ncbi:unnamed protein product [Candidula unifasciata]|uniref:Leucine-rich repeat-containing protein 15 n=1 Tax=Candidula unifasciata TaxID=100452 RepID=A0A8S3ZK79_9EUPU|nr:unnamed protein product [Candidula unifasciata]
MALTFNIAMVAALTFATCLQIVKAQTACPSRCRSCDNNVAECSQRSLTAPPKFYPQGIRTINLENNHIRVIAERTFGNLDSVEVLKISSNKIVAIRDDSFSSFPNLVSLDLMDNRISRISRRAFKDLNKLRTLSLNRNRLDSLQGILQYVPNLFQLNVANNRITTIGQNDLSPISRVHYLDLRDNLITSIHSKAFKNLIHIRYLFLNNNPLTSTPAFEFGSQVLQLVDFSSCELRQVPGPLPASVSDLRLGNNRIMQVRTTDFTNITDLQLLTLNDNELHFLEDGSLSHLTQLREIWLRNNSLVYIPRGIPNNVRNVHMDSNNIQQIEPGIFSNMSHLDYLTVESNQINRIQPNTFRGLRFLNTLNFQGNRIQNLEPETFVDLGSLSTLLLSNNPMVRIETSAFKNLGNLTQLFLSYIVEENFHLAENFFPQMLRLQTLHLVNSPGLVNDLMDMINDSAIFAIPLEHMQQLDLSYNTLEWVSPRIRVVFPNLLSMPLDGNPLRCSRSLKWLRDWMVSSEVNFNNYNEIVCETPLRLKDRAVRSIEDHEWENDEASEESGEAAAGNQQPAAQDQAGNTRSEAVSSIQTRVRADRQGVGKRSHVDADNGKIQRKGKGKGQGKGKGKKENKGSKKSKKGKSTVEKTKKKGKEKKNRQQESLATVNNKL